MSNIMQSWKHLERLVNGLTLVGNEIINRSSTFRIARDGDLEALIGSSVKKAVVAATDLTGLTSGNVRELSSPKTKVPSVVYFDGEKEKDNGRIEHFSKEESANGNQSDGAVRVNVENKFDGVQVSGAAVIDENDSSAREEKVMVSIDESNTNADVGAGERTVIAAATPIPAPTNRRRPRERRVPSTPFTRALGFAGLGAGLAWGTLQESAKRLAYGTPSSQDNQSALSPFLSEKNAERLALALCRMRGAALKVGQMLSIQDESLVPAPILAALDIVRQGADVMPKSQLDQVLDAELGSNWQSKLASFDYEPLAAASIGQVHRAVTRDGIQVAMKIQYPGVANSIESDIENVKLLLNYTNLIPEGLFLDRAIEVAKDELARECNYELEAANQKKFRHLLSNTHGFYVPFVIDQTSSKRVLTTELVSGVPVDKVALLNQETRDYVGRKLLELTMMELFVFRFMQTDPNWGNFLYDDATKTINLIDFGAARDYPKRFVDDYLKMVLACANKDRDAVIEMSKSLGFLDGTESDVMLDAHVQAGFIVGLPFSDPGGYDFRANNITQSVSNLGARMLNHRRTPPPDEAYSLHRKLSGAFLACIRLGAVVPCREILLDVYEEYRFGEEGEHILSTASESH